MSKRTVLALVCLVMMIISVPAFAAKKKGGATSKDITAKAQKSRGAGEDANIKNAKPKNTMDDTTAPPPWKSATKSRGNYTGCRLHVDNRTPWYVEIYEDGDYVGTVSPFGDSYGSMADHTVLYARAVFDDGSTIGFGPDHAQCWSTTFTWSLTR